ncbi:MAG: hypothetical protein JNG85_13025, partial [Spirochaetaceae bacterium]|nr:hypothetical protein [Spirochaetaceae bacterium]
MAEPSANARSVRRRLSAFTLGLSSLFLLSTCDLAKVGLGNKVDIRPPEITIDSPANNGYIRGDLVVSGTVADDLGVQAVRVLVDGLAHPAAVSGGGWSVTLPVGSGGLQDGRKILTAVAVDGAGKDRSAEVAVNVDNKAPTVLVTSPVTTDSLVTDYVDLKGEVYDPSTIASVSVSLINPANGAVIAGPSPADGTNTWNIRFILKANAAALGLPPGGTAPYKYRVVVTDAAGNTSAYYYHRSGIIATKDPAAVFPSMDEIGKLDQLGTVGSSGVTAAELEGVRLDAVAEYAGFTYEADPSMDFQYTNIEKGGSAETNTLAPKSILTGLIVPPTGSGAAIDVNSLKVEFLQYDAPNAVVCTLLNTLPGDTDGLKVLAVGDSVSFAAKLLKAGLAADLDPNKYKLRVTASTDTGITKSGNVEEFTIDAEAPAFGESEIAPTDLFRRQPFLFNLAGSHSTDISKIEIYQSYNGAAFPATADQVMTFPAGTKSFAGALSAAYPAGSLGDGLYNYKLTLSTVGGKTTTLLRTVTYDSTAPNLEVGNLSPVVGADTVNGTVNLSVSATDSNGIGAVRYWLQAAGDAAPTWNAAGRHEWLVPPYARAIDTTAVGLSGAVKLWLIARDKAGN